MDTEKIKIIEELATLSKSHDTEDRGSSYRPFKYYKHIQGKDIPVFFVGVPGVTVAIVMTLLIVTTIYMITLPFSVVLWLLYLLVILRLAMKIDKAKQIRFMVATLCSMAVRMLEKANESEEHVRLRLAGQAKTLLEKAHSWVDEPLILTQLAELESFEALPFD
jgi:hypothetical protein